MIYKMRARALRIYL